MAEINLSPVTADYEAMLRRRKMAEALMQQAQAPGTPNNEMAGGYVIRKSPYEGLAKMLQMGIGAWGAKRADQEMKDLANKRQEAMSADQNALVDALKVAQTGKPEIPMPADELGGGPGRAAQAPTGKIDPAIMGQLQTPEGKQQAVQLLMQQLAPKGVHTVAEGGSLVRDDGQVLFKGTPKQETFAKIDPAKYTPESVQAFAASGNRDFTVLRPDRKSVV